jgi:hypothetical protein
MLGVVAEHGGFSQVPMNRVCSAVDTGKLQPTTLGVTVPLGRPLQISLVAANQARIISSRSCCLLRRSHQVIDC